MAASTSAWRFRLNNHPVFDVLKKELDWLQEIKDSRRFLAISDGRLFLWNPHNYTVCTTNLKSLLDSEATTTFQTLLPSNPPVCNIEEIILNHTDQCLALIGRTGVSVIQLPQKWGKGGHYGGGAAKVMCKTIVIGERFFSCSHRVQVLQASWHPGSAMGSHLAVLTSDNWLRIYNLIDPDAAEQSIQLGDAPNISSSGMSSISLSMALGHQAVAFDFCIPEPLVRRGKRNPADSTLDAPMICPIYVLWANGDIYMLVNSVNTVSPPLKTQLRGPLVMLPPAEDNYGTDACSLLCLHSRPPILVVGTPAGKLYHCVLLNTDDEEASISGQSWSEKESTVYDLPPEPTLYFYESVELELSLTTVALETDELVYDDFTCPLRLHHDPDNHFRYHCSHSAGVHSVVLPWSQQFQQFCDEAQMKPMEPHSADQEAVVEHLVCTKPHSASEACPILGLCVTADRLLGSTLICLTSSAECVTLPLLPYYRGEPPMLQSSTMDRSLSPLRKLHKEPLDTHIRNILTRNTVNPLIKTSASADLAPQECFQLLSRATQVFREEYIQKLDLARQEINKRLCVLKEQKEFQQDELARFQQLRNKMRQDAENLAEKYEDARDSHEQLIYRLETVLKKLQSRLPMLSEAERQMYKELKSLEDRLGSYKQAIQQLQTKQEYQQRQMQDPRHDKLSSSLLSSPSLNKNNTDQLKDILTNQGNQISDLVSQVRDMKLQLQV